MPRKEQKKTSNNFFQLGIDRGYQIRERKIIFKLKETQIHPILEKRISDNLLIFALPNVLFAFLIDLFYREMN